ncbi:MAG TPA: hypothetical protein VHW06_00860 [Streptosporangiaceae bacterium]|nr:hypothetical protein [Streptosporangiaceae bacterium]
MYVPARADLPSPAVVLGFALAIVASRAACSSAPSPGASLTAAVPAGSAGFEALDATQSLVMRPDLNTEGGPEALLATPGYVAAWPPAADGRWAVTGLRPGGGTAWTSSRFPGAVFLANDASTVYVITCTPWKQDQSGVCAEVSLAAVAA